MVICSECDDQFCELCYLWLHGRGKRKAHNKVDLPHAKKKQASAKKEVLTPSPSSSSSSNAASNEPQEEPLLHPEMLKLREAVMNDLEVYPLVDRCKYIPLRLNSEERVLLNILEGALEVSEYTDNVDVSDSDYGRGSWGFSMWSQPYSRHERSGPSRSELILKELREVFDLLIGLYQCSDYRLGSHLLKSEDGDAKYELIQRIFEVGRRHKIMNPEKMRGTYGKMMYILQDAAKPGRLPFVPIIPIKTVYSILEEKNSLHLITDPEMVKLVLIATNEIVSDRSKSREEIQVQLEAKNFALKELLSKYKSENLSEDDIIRCVSSIADNTTFITLERWPVDRMLHYLTSNFGVQKGQGPSLAIQYGQEGSKLSHDHSTQFTFVLQSLMLWREVITNMFRLWVMAETDLLSTESTYLLRDTGQGLNRVQSCPHVSRAMHSILGKVQHQAKGWVGLSVVHLGDRDVPNALMFIDKYTQVARILGPIAQCLDRLPTLEQDANLKKYFERFGGMTQLRNNILQDYYRHGFDGSGSDGGSCIDGRLTSSWNWCAKIEKKKFFPLFLLSGFKGFDGSFR